MVEKILIVDEEWIMQNKEKLEKLAGKVAEVGKVPAGDITKVNKIKPKKISCWEDLMKETLSTIRGLSAKVTEDIDVGHVATIFIDGEEDFDPVSVIDWSENSIKKMVQELRRFGFDLEYVPSFNLVEFLKEILYKKTFKPNEPNYYLITFGNVVRLNSEGQNQILGTLYFGSKIDSPSYIIEKKFKENKVTKIQLIGALEELGWM